MKGGRHFLHDVRHNGGMPTQVARHPFKFGVNTAATSGSVVYRAPMFELIQYHPTTAQVHAIPTVLIPPQINRYYFLDIAPGRSFIEYAVSQGIQVLCISWRSPTPRQRDWDLDNYASACVEAMHVASKITKSPTVNIAGFCAGGMTTVVLVDPDFLPLLEEVAGHVPTLRRIVVLDDEADETDDPRVIAYESLIAAASAEREPRDLDERLPAGLCYTSETTGRPKGVVSTHRSVFLHALAVTSAAGISIGPGDCVLPQVPMFHASAWGLPYAAVAVGAKLVFFGGPLEAGPFVDLLLDEAVSVSAAVPTVWVTAGEELARRPGFAHRLRHVICGGSQPPQALIERYLQEFDIPIVQAWGMTETSPLASVAWPQERMHAWEPEAVVDAARRQAGLPLPGVLVRLRDEHGAAVPFDGESMGALEVRGPWVTDSYLHGHGAENFSEDGWFTTGDVAVGSPDGYFVIADRTKDLIKSGGEWISSVDMEAAIMAMPEVIEAAVIAVPDPKWVERPIAFVVPSPGRSVDHEMVCHHLEEAGFARWQLPDRVELIDEFPKTAVGKFDKKALREREAP